MTVSRTKDGTIFANQNGTVVGYTIGPFLVIQIGLVRVPKIRYIDDTNNGTVVNTNIETVFVTKHGTVF